MLRNSISFFIFFLVFGCSKENEEGRVFKSYEKEFTTEDVEYPRNLIWADNKIILFNNFNQKFSFYSSEGELLSQFGVRGEGPKEFLQVAGVPSFVDERLYVYDRGLNSLKILDITKDSLLSLHKFDDIVDRGIFCGDNKFIFQTHGENNTAVIGSLDISSRQVTYYEKLNNDFFGETGSSMLQDGFFSDCSCNQVTYVPYANNDFVIFDSNFENYVKSEYIFQFEEPELIQSNNSISLSSDATYHTLDVSRSCNRTFVLTLVSDKKKTSVVDCYNEKGSYEFSLEIPFVNDAPAKQIAAKDDDSFILGFEDRIISYYLD